MVVAEIVEQDAEISEPIEQKKNLSLEILKIIKDSQQQHGLRHSDYQRYRCYCSRRIRRLRKTMHLPQGDKRRYKRCDVTETHLTDNRVLLIPLMQAERAWSYAMQLRQEANTEPRKNFHMKSRLIKASKHAVALQELCQSEVCDARTKLEAQAYVAWIQGSLLFELQNWQQSLENLQQAQVVYSKLSEAATSEEDEALYNQRCEELRPSMRYCAYNIGDSSAMEDLQTMRTNLSANDAYLLEKLDALMEEARGKSGQLEEVEWRGMKLAVQPASVGVFLAAEEQLAARSTPPDINTLERHLIHSKDAITAVKEFAASDSTWSGGAGKGKASGSQSLLTYLMHIRLSRTIQRTLIMADNIKNEVGGKKGKPQDSIRLYEMILQNLSEMQVLPGLENDSEYQKSILSDISKYKAFRCHHMSEALKSSRHMKEALAVIERGLGYAEQASAGPELKALIDEMTVARCITLAEAALQLDAPTATSAPTPDKKPKGGEVPLIDRLDEYRESSGVSSKPNLVHMPPDMQPVSYKPLFFDVAVNHLEFPKLDDKPATASQQGITGFVKNLWGWGSSK